MELSRVEGLPIILEIDLFGFLRDDRRLGEDRKRSLKDLVAKENLCGRDESETKVRVDKEIIQKDLLWCVV